MLRPFVLLFLSFLTSLVQAQSPPEVSYNRDIRPILAKHCGACHGPDEGARQADLRLDSFESATTVRDNRTAIRPSDPSKSELVRRISSEDPEVVMPPPDAGPPLTPPQIELLRKWIAAGAKFEAHWAFVPPVRPSLPMVTQTDWIKQPIDQFVLSKLENAGLSPSPTADRATLLRRLYLDLLGIPPSPDDVTEFLNSTDPQCYERIVDDLLARAEFGEKWGRTWLDLARYADTNGYEKDRARTIWPYRDWVIDAINEDVPFDQFTVHQIAGDMLKPPNPEAKIATGLHRNTMLNEEGGIDPLEFRFYAMNDRVATTGLIWMGLTTGCAQCHSHKFDPISHTEYYQFMALLNNADEPDQEVLSPSLEAERKRIEQEMESKVSELAMQFPIEGDTVKQLSPEEKVAQSRLAFDCMFANWAEQQRAQSVAWKVVVPSQMTTNMPRLEALEDGSIYSTGDITKRDVFELTITKAVLGYEPITSLRLEVLPDPRLPAGGPGRSYYEGRRGDFFLSEINLHDGQRIIKIRDASHSYGKNGLGSGSADAKNVFDGDGSTGWSTAQREAEAHQLVLILDEPLRVTESLKIEMLFERHYATSLGRFRWSVSSSEKVPVAQDLSAALQAALTQERAQWSESEERQLQRHFALTCTQLAAARKDIERLRKSLPTVPSTLVMQERPADNPRPTHRHHRGEYLSPREEVTGAIPEILSRHTAQPPHNRLELARWLASTENPLVGHVIVNRMWQSLFGEGLVRSQGDFGTQCSPPTHPELLDWLALDWIESGWSMKKLCRDIVLSSTYQQSSTSSQTLRARDPENLLLARFSRQRLDAEILRDVLLQSSGLLCNQVGGPSVRPPQPASVTALAYGGEAWQESKGSDRFRRSLYTFSKRTAPFAAYQVFDAPSGETCSVRRERSNTPLQALTLLNDRMFIEIAEALGYLVYTSCQDDQRRAVQLAFRVWSRPPTEAEVSSIINYVDQQRPRIVGGELSPEIQFSEDERIKQLVAKEPNARAWILAARGLMNTDEAVVKP